MTTYRITNTLTQEVVATGLTIEAAAEMLEMDQSELEWALDEEGVCEVDDLICEAELN